MRLFTFFVLPPDLRLEVYKHLLPTANLGGSDAGSSFEEQRSASNVRFLCRQIKEEYDYELIKDANQYRQQLVDLIGATCTIEPVHTVQDANRLAVCLKPIDTKMGLNFDAPIVIILDNLVPTIRVLNIFLDTHHRPGDIPYYVFYEDAFTIDFFYQTEHRALGIQTSLCWTTDNGSTHGSIEYVRKTLTPDRLVGLGRRLIGANRLLVKQVLHSPRFSSYYRGFQWHY